MKRYIRSNDYLTEEQKAILRKADTSDWSRMQTERTEDEIREAEGYDKYCKANRRRSEVDAASNISISQLVKKVHQAKDELAKYDKEKVDFVLRCQDDIMKAISDHYSEEHIDDDMPIGPSLSQIKNDWCEQALEDDLMTEEEFDDIFNLLDIISIETAHAQA